jgi:pimeloyl-ACP methyl ester carboxylesterase
MSSYKTFSLRVIDGSKIVFQRWGVGNPKRVYCMHGWLDNSNSFIRLGPLLASQGFEVTACDLVGHGLSSHSPGTLTFTDYVQHAREILLELDIRHLIGHSMGTAVSLMLAGSYPESIDSIVCIDGFGPTCRPAGESAKILRFTSLVHPWK